jgi:hypothetical protein
LGSVSDCQGFSKQISFIMKLLYIFLKIFSCNLISLFVSIHYRLCVYFRCKSPITKFCFSQRCLHISFLFYTLVSHYHRVPFHPDLNLTPANRDCLTTLIGIRGVKKHLSLANQRSVTIFIEVLYRTVCHDNSVQCMSSQHGTKITSLTPSTQLLFIGEVAPFVYNKSLNVSAVIQLLG